MSHEYEAKPWYWSQDFNEDDIDDFLFQHTDGRGAIWLLDNQDDDPGDTLGQEAFSPGSPWDIVGAADFNDDDLADIIEQSNTDGTVRIQFADFYDPEDLDIYASFVIEDDNGDPLVPGLNWRIADTGDLDRDSDLTPDLLFQNTDGRVGLWYLEEDSEEVVAFDTAVLSANPGPLWHLIGAADFFQTSGQAVNDEAEDIFNPDWTVANANGAQYDIYFQHDDGRVGAWHVAGQTKDGDPVVTDFGVVDGNPGTSWDLLSTEADFDTDGFNDLVFQHDDGRVGVWLMEEQDDSEGLLIPEVADQIVLGTAVGWEFKGVGDYDDDDEVDDLRFQSTTTGEVGVVLITADDDPLDPEDFDAFTAADIIVVDGNPGLSWELLYDANLLNA
jgi:hypothetical protein